MPCAAAQKHTQRSQASQPWGIWKPSSTGYSICTRDSNRDRGHDRIGVIIRQACQMVRSRLQDLEALQWLTPTVVELTIRSLLGTPYLFTTYLDRAAL